MSQALSIPTVADVMAALYDVIDPDLGVNVVDMGFVYGVDLAGDGTAVLTMTLTSPACPLTGVIEDQVATALTGSGLLRGFTIDWVWKPTWTPGRITADGREQLQAIGFSF